MSDGSGVVSLLRSLLHASVLALESGCAGGTLNQTLILFLQEVLGCFCPGQENRRARLSSFSCCRLQQMEMQAETPLWFILSHVTTAPRNVRFGLRFAREGVKVGVAQLTDSQSPSGRGCDISHRGDTSAQIKVAFPTTSQLRVWKHFNWFEMTEKAS